MPWEESSLENLGQIEVLETYFPSEREVIALGISYETQEHSNKCAFGLFPSS
jgi:hypothetical protein